MVEVASLNEVPLREVWPDEARDFTPWLAAHPEHLGEKLRMDLELEGEEVAVGPFSADLVLRDLNTDNLVVVENLLGMTDHDHLGKLMTYAAGLEAHWTVLIAKTFRPEHRTALNWLNSISDENSGFFGIEVHAVRIGESPAAVQLDVVVEPDDFSRRVHAEKKPMSETRTMNVAWWDEFLPEFRKAYPDWTKARKPSSDPWMRFPYRGDAYALSFSQRKLNLSAQVWLTKREFLALKDQRSAIEDTCDLELQWEPRENNRSSCVAVYLDPFDPADRDKWPTCREWAIKTLGELRRVFDEPTRALS